MMDSKLRPVFLIVAASLLLPLSVAEISVGKGATGRGFLMAGGGGSGADPFPVFDIIRIDIDPALILNATGAGNGDYGPSFAIDPVTGDPEVAWAWWDGNDYEIALSRWTGGSWSPWEILTDNAVDDLEPALTIDAAGTRRVSWWRSGSEPQVWLLERFVGDEVWTPEERVTRVVEGGSRPGVVALSGVVRVAYQREGAAVREVVVSTRDGAWQPEVLAVTGYQGPGGDGDIDVVAHRKGTTLWVDWIDAEGVLAYRVYDPHTNTWGVRQTQVYSWDTASGETEYWARESARALIRRGLAP
ncbi:MAG: hypothetical protein Q9Q40_02040 [Acidobacteriota bacterium]|nr:hypothetical protein [Acidobacteriota bacterium]MDQ7088585.1 hypothetical protein [Acidobacteriota bacterium]